MLINIFWYFCWYFGRSLKWWNVFGSASLNGLVYGKILTGPFRFSHWICSFPVSIFPQTNQLCIMFLGTLKVFELMKCLICFGFICWFFFQCFGVDFRNELGWPPPIYTMLLSPSDVACTSYNWNCPPFSHFFFGIGIGEFSGFAGYISPLVGRLTYIQKKVTRSHGFVVDEMVTWGFP